MKTAVIYCFSGTGNTLRVANNFKDAMERKGTAVTVAVVKKGENVPSERDFDFVGIAYPVHGFNAPLPIWDLAKGFPGAQVRDNAMSKARFEFRWKDQFNLSLDPARAKQYYVESHESDDKFCTMCGPNFCAMRITQKVSEEICK